MITCLLRIEEDFEKINPLFSPEDHNSLSERVEYKIRKKNNCTEIEITANDITSLRGCINSVLKILETYKKIDDLK